MGVNFISSKDNGETRSIYVWSDNVNIMWGSDTANIIKELFESFLNDYQKEEQIIKGSDFNLESVDLMDYKLHRVRLRRGGSKKIKHEDKDFSLHQRYWRNFEQNNKSIALNVLMTSQNSGEITLVYKSEHNFIWENNVLLLMINDDDDEKCYYFAVKNKLELYSSELLRSKKSNN